MTASTAAEPAWYRRPRAISTTLVVAMLVIWQLVHVVAGDNRAGDSMVPGILDIVHAAKGLSREWPGGWGVQRTDLGGAETWRGAVLAFVYHSGITGLRTMGGYLLGVAGGLGLAAVVSWSPLLRRIAYLPAHTARMLPLLALIPLFGLWFGNSTRGAVLFVAFTVFVYMFAFGINSIANVPTFYADAARSLGSGRTRTYLEVILPAALPEFGSGLSLSLALGWSAGISAEFNGQTSGLGQIAYIAQYFTRTGLLALMALAVIGYAAASFLLARRLVAWATRWAE